ncbi:NAD(P)H-hydrate dehydratase [Thermovibrio sp.]
MRLLKSSEMQEVDRHAIEVLGIPGAVLMENAARGVCEVIYREVDGTSALVVCGKGNNGGDGLAVARNLYNLGYDVEVVLTSPIEKLKGDARLNAQVLSLLPVPIHVVDSEEKLFELFTLGKEADFVVDALFGTGLSKPLSGFYAEVVEVINGFNKPIVSVDIPSGLSSDSGSLIGPHVKADYTVTFAYPKVAHLFPPACYSVGELFIVDISIPEDVANLRAPDRFILTADEVAFTYPFREIMSHKYTFGHVAVIGGSVGKTGAPIMAAEGALRAGAGLVSVIVPESLNSIFEVKLTEVMSIPVKDNGKGYFGIDSLSQVLSVIERGKFSAVVIGPGIGSSEESYEFVREFVKECTLPMVIDADGINALASCPELLKLKEQEVVLTPHIGEFSRIASLSKEEILSLLPDVGLDFAKSFNCTLVLKSGRTVISTPKGKTFVNVIGNPGMATAGTGDVLAGIIGALLGMGIDGEDASKLGVFLHSLSGDLAVKDLTEEGLVATDLIRYLPKAISRLKEYETSFKKPSYPFITSLKELVGEE